MHYGEGLASGGGLLSFDISTQGRAKNVTVRYPTKTPYETSDTILACSRMMLGPVVFPTDGVAGSVLWPLSPLPTDNSVNWRGTGGHGDPVSSHILIRSRDVKVVGEGFPVHIVTRVMRQNYRHFRHCYESALKHDQDLTGSASIAFVVDENGFVSEAATRSLDISNPPLLSCLTHVIYGLAFREPSAGTIQVELPLRLSTSECACEQARTVH